MTEDTTKAPADDGRGFTEMLGAGVAICTECGEPMTHGGTCMTLVGYSSPPGHNHDDNCRSRIYVCANGHRLVVSRQNSCNACDWRGKIKCFCHAGEKVPHWPGEAPND